MNLVDEFKDRDFVSDLKRLYSCLSPRRKWQLVLLFILQSISAVSEVASLGAVVPFLSALTNIDALIADPRAQSLMNLTGIEGRDQLIMALAGLFAAAIVIANILRFVTLWAQYRLGAAIGTDLGRQLFEKTLHQPYSFFVRSNSSHLIGNATNDLSGALGIIHNIFIIITQGLIAAAISIGLVAYDPLVALALSGITVIAFSVIMIAVKRRLFLNSAIISDSYRGVVKSLQEGFGGIRFILLHRSQKTFVDQFELSDRAFRLKSSENSVVRQAPRFFIEAIGVTAISILAMVFIMQDRDINQVIPLLGFLALGCYRLLPAVQQVYASITALMGLKTSLHRTMDMLGRPLPDGALKSELQALPMFDRLSFDRVWFDYRDGLTEDRDEWALKEISISIPARSTVALVGSTGSGKSTLADLILGLTAPTEGAIKIDGTPLTPQTLPAWQKSVAHVPQHIFLTDASIAENIAFGVPKDRIDLALVRECAKSAHLDGFITGLAHGYDHIVGERGARISGGQLQRIGIARALYHRPTTIMFDEATSALDNKTEREVMESIAGLSKDMTVVLIAHRLSTVKNADIIFLLDKGRVIAQGTYEQLLASSVHFKKLVADADAVAA